MDSNVKVKLSQNPRVNASIFEILTYSWMLNLFKIGQSRDLKENDFYVTLKDHTSSTLGDELEKKWKLELANAYKDRRNPSLSRALIKIFGAKYGSCGFLLFIDEIIFRVSKPLFIGGLLTHFNPDLSDKTELWYAFMCATGLGFSVLATIILVHSTVMEIFHNGMKIRVACSSIIFRKALRLSHTALCETTSGQVINLLSNDVNRFDRGLIDLHYLWIGPLQTIVVTCFLWREIGVSSLLGVAFLICFIPLQGWLGKKVFEIRLKAAQRTDDRGQLMNEIIMGIQAIKVYTWEKPFEQLIRYARKKEIQHIRGITSINAVSFLYKGIQIKFQLFACILSYVLLGNYMTSKKVFVIISFYNLLQNSMSSSFFNGISQIGEILVSIQRIQNFLLLEENDGIIAKSIKRMPDTIKTCQNYFANSEENRIYKKNNFELTQNVGIDILNVNAKWSKHQTTNTLENVNLTIRPGHLVAIIGPVGAGKSSLIQLILGELPVSEGSISVKGVVSYAPQEPWLFTGSVQQNILFNSPMNRNRYKQVIKLCALQQDFEQFPYADRTIVGERGVTLSGGQKSRINLARAIYKEADIYLLDDPLSAVDSRVGRYLFEKCIKDYLRNKICILVTHQIQFLTNVKQIVLMDNASILAKGSSQKLRTSGIDYAKFLRISEEINIESDINAKNNAINGTHILCPRESNESLSSHIDENKFSGTPKEPNQVAEFRSSGKVSKNVYTSYLSSVGSTCNVFLFFFMFILTQLLTSGGDYWISFWVNQEDRVFKNKYKIVDENSTLMNCNSTDLSSTNFRQTCIRVYVALNILLIIAMCIGFVIFVSVCTKASFNLHNMMFDAIIRAKMYFFNTNSSGRILNRFSNDLGSIDTVLPIILIDCLQLGMKILGVVIIVGVINIYLLIPTIIMGAICFRIRSFCLPTSRSIKRLEGIARSPILSYFNATIQGIKTIRVYEAEQIINNEFDKNLDSHSSAWYLFLCSNGAFGLWLDIVCFIYICILIFFLVFSNNTYGSYAGLAITQTISLVGLFQWTIKQFAMLENQMNSVERIFEYVNSPKEVNLLTPSDKIPPKNWPYAGKIVFRNLNLYYGPDSPCILKNLNFQIQPTEKIGIIGRTGAGKSSIISAIFRLAQNEGSIIIDDIEIHELELYALRSKLSVIPQEPVLFSGTMRTNLDPFEKYPDHVLWKALEEVRLKVTIAALPGGLNSKISECGSNFSAGQKQLVCLARALVQNNKILILDEATANVDAQTDTLIQNTIKNKFRTCTVLTVAHRLNTVMDSDRILVMNAGSVVEFDYPHILLKNKYGFLYSMVEQTGLTTSNLLHSIAATSYKNIRKKENLPMD